MKISCGKPIAELGRRSRLGSVVKIAAPFVFIICRSRDTFRSESRPDDRNRDHVALEFTILAKRGVRFVLCILVLAEARLPMMGIKKLHKTRTRRTNDPSSMRQRGHACQARHRFINTGRSGPRRMRLTLAFLLFPVNGN